MNWSKVFKCWTPLPASRDHTRCSLPTVSIFKRPHCKYYLSLSTSSRGSNNIAHPLIDRIEAASPLLVYFVMAWGIKENPASFWWAMLSSIVDNNSSGQHSKNLIICHLFPVTIISNWFGRSPPKWNGGKDGLRIWGGGRWHFGGYPLVSFCYSVVQNNVAFKLVQGSFSIMQVQCAWLSF